MGNKKGYWAGEKNPKYQHGFTKLKAYQVWSDMIRRCYNPKSSIYKYYGARGIQVSPEWRESFKNFYNDMGDPPTGLQLERIDNDLGYSIDNCKWGTKLEQMNNRRNSVRFTFNGETKTLSEWSRETGLQWTVLANRINRKWPHDMVLYRGSLRGRRDLKAD